MGAARLTAAGVDNAGLDTRLLLAHALGVDQATMLRDQTVAVPSAFEPLLARRAAREPLALILGRQGFWTLDLEVSRDTLIPRADSETLVEAVLAARPDRRTALRVLDLGTGTGCLLLAVLSEYPGAWGVGVDIAPGAAVLAARNAAGAGVAARASFVVADWATAISGQFNVVLSNPPYIPAWELPGLMPEVAGFEPWRALDGGVDGLVAYRSLLACLPGLLAPGGLAVFELGHHQSSVVQPLAEQAGFSATVRLDLNGVERALVLEKRVGIEAGSH